MKHVLFLLIFFATTINSLFCDSFKFFDIKGNFSDDPKNPYRYSIYKALDSNDKTSAAFNHTKNESEEFLFAIETMKNCVVDGIYLRNGYFDQKFYNKNFRIKKLKIYFGYPDPNNKIDTVIINLQDTNEEIFYKFKKKYKISHYVYFMPLELYPSEEYTDICLTSMNFACNKEKLENEYYNPAVNICYNEYSFEKNRIVSLHTRTEYVNYSLTYERQNNVIYGANDKLIFKRTGSVSEGTVIEKYNDIVVSHYFMDGKIFKTKIEQNGAIREFKYYYNNGRLESTDHGDFIYKENKITGFLHGPKGGDPLCPSFEIKYDYPNNKVKIISNPSLQSGTDGLIATWIGLDF